MARGKRRELLPDVQQIVWVTSKSTKRTKARCAKDKSTLDMAPEAVGSPVLSSPAQRSQPHSASQLATPLQKPSTNNGADQHDLPVEFDWENMWQDVDLEASMRQSVCVIDV